MSPFGTGGFVSAMQGPSLHRIDNSTDVRLVSVIDRLSSSTPDYLTGTESMISVSEVFSGGTVSTQLLERPILYARKAMPWSDVTPPRRGP